jgi:excisionase family DNA binding protein
MRHRKPSTLPFEQRGGVSRDETAQYLGIGGSAVDDLVKDGKLKSARIGKRLIIVAKSAVALLHAEAAA